MGAAIKQADKKNLQELVPLNALSETRFAEISKKIVIEAVRKGRYLFRKGDRDNQSIYLLDGKINLIDGHRKVTSEVKAGTDISRYPVANQQPRLLSARAATKVVIARVDSGLLDVFLTWDQSSGAEVTEIMAGDDEDWMTRILQSEAFIKIPPAVIQRLLMKMQSFPLRAGKTVIAQGDEGDFFYTIHQGRCAVTRKDTPDGEIIKLAELSAGDCFGEEALVSDARRNASVTMLTDGVLMRLAKKDFVELLQEHLINTVSFKKAAGMVDTGAVWLDVRSAGEYEASAFEDSVNIPLSGLRSEIPELVFNATYIICCDTGRRSSSAAFLLSHKGFEVYVLDGGLNGLAPDVHMQADLPEEIQGASYEDATVIDINSNHETAATGQTAASTSVESEAGVVEASAHTVEENGGRGRHAGEQLKELEVLRLENARLGKEVIAHQESERDLEIRLSELEQLEVEVRDAKAQLSSMQKKVESEAEEEQLLRDQYAALQEEYEHRVKQFELDLGRLKGQCENLQAENETGEQEKQQLQGQFESEQQTRQKELECLEGELRHFRQQAESLQAELAAVNEQAEQYRSDSEATLHEQYQLVEPLRGELDRSHQEIEQLNTRIVALTSAADKEVQTVNDQLEAEQKHASAARQEVTEQVAQIESLREQLAQQEEERLGLEKEKVTLQQKQEEMRQQVQQVEAHFSALDLENQESLKKTYDDLTRKNDTEKEMQGQIKRLRKKLEQSAEDLQEARNEARESAELFREELNSERRARTDERAQLAARQRELKEQLAAVANEHEEVISTRDGTLAQAKVDAREEERARLQQALAEQVQSEETIASLQVELNRVHEEIAQAVQQERVRSEADLVLAREQKEEADEAIIRFESQLEQLTQERDTALDEHQAAREQLNMLRADLQVELNRAHEEIAQAVQQERVRSEADQVLAREQKEEAGEAIIRFESQLEQLTQERDTALDEHQAAREQLNMLRADLQVELNRAHEEIAQAVQQERVRSEADLVLAREQKEEADEAIIRFESQLEQLTQERDTALDEHQAACEQLNTLRGEVDVARGLMGAGGNGRVEDPVKLRAELEEIKKNVEIAVRLRSEAEVQRDRAVEERNELHRQIEESGLADTRLHVPSLDGADYCGEKPVASPDPAGPGRTGIPSDNTQSRPAEFKTVKNPGGGSWRGWLGKAAGLGVIGISALVLMYLLRTEYPLIFEFEDEQVLAGESVPEPAEAGLQEELAVPVEIVSADKPVLPVPDEHVEDLSTQEAQGVSDDRISAIPDTPAVSAVRSFRDTLQDGSKGPWMVELPAAHYMMGSVGSSMNFDERPQHRVDLAAYSIGKYEVSFAEYDRFARATGRRLPSNEGWGRGNRPVINVSWKDARAYASWLSKQTGHQYRLPSEAEWEFAARAGSNNAHWWDTRADTVQANCFDCGSQWDGTRTAVVGSFPANGLDLHDTAGNVQEWTEDCYHSSYNDAAADGSAWQAPRCTQQVVRGGSYTSPIDSLRSARRGQYAHDTRLDNLGFRIVREK